MSVTALKPSSQPMTWPVSTVAPGSVSNPSSTISPSMRTANFVNPTRHTSSSSRSSQLWPAV